MTLYASFSKNTIRFGKVAMFLFAVSASAATNFFTVISVDGAIRACSNDTEAVLEETKCGQKNMSLAWLSLFVYIVTALYSVFKNFDVAESMFSELDAAALDAFETSLRTDNPLPDKRGQRQKNEGLRRTLVNYRRSNLGTRFPRVFPPVPPQAEQVIPDQLLSFLSLSRPFNQYTNVGFVFLSCVLTGFGTSESFESQSSTVMFVAAVGFALFHIGSARALRRQMNAYLLENSVLTNQLEYLLAVSRGNAQAADHHLTQEDHYRRELERRNRQLTRRLWWTEDALEEEQDAHQQTLRERLALDVRLRDTRQRMRQAQEALNMSENEVWYLERQLHRARRDRVILSQGSDPVEQVISIFFSGFWGGVGYTVEQENYDYDEFGGNSAYSYLP